jgi:hypothetical protein
MMFQAISSHHSHVFVLRLIFAEKRVGDIKEPRIFSPYSEHKISLTSLMTVYSICSYAIVSQISLCFSLSLSLRLSLAKKDQTLRILFSLCAPLPSNTPILVYTLVFGHIKFWVRWLNFTEFGTNMTSCQVTPTIVIFNLGRRSCQAAVTMPHKFRSWQIMTTWLNSTSPENVIFLCQLKQNNGLLFWW